MSTRSNHPLHARLAELRAASRWPDQEGFALQCGLSPGGYKKIETGERLPSRAVLLRICFNGGFSEAVERELMQLLNEAKAQQVGIPTCRTQAVDCDALAKRIRTELVFVLKQTGIDVNEATKGVLEKRVAMILKSSLGA